MKGQGFFRPNAKFVALWNVAWALALTALIPVINAWTPLLNPQYNNVWTPDVYWRLVLYWHGAIFMPMVAVGACVLCMTFGLDKVNGRGSRLLCKAVNYGGLIAGPLAGIGGIFDIYDRFALGIPLWTQIVGFLIGDEIAIALIIVMLLYPKVSGKGYDGVGLPYYTALAALIGVLIAAVEGHIAGWITWFGPWPSFVANYINQTMFAIGYTNFTYAVGNWTENVVTSHSHTMLPLIMAGIASLAAVAFGYYEMKGAPRLVAAIGFLVMSYMIVAVTWLYIVAGVGNYVIPTLFQSGPGGVNGLAMDDAMTGMIGWGALLVLIGLVIYLKRTGRLRDPFFVTVLIAAVLIYLTLPVTGYYIEFHESYYGFATPPAPGWRNDFVYLRFHQDFGLFTLPSVILAVLLFKQFDLTDAERRLVSSLLVAGMVIAFAGGEAYFITLAQPWLYLALVGAALIWLGLAFGTFYAWRSYAAGPKGFGCCSV
ncbi:MAG: hypothetical protein ACP5FT_01200 [Acidilobus sp.]